MDPRAADVLAFWFGDSDAAREAWFRKDPAFDAEIGARFGALIEAALDGRLDDWPAQGADAALARILLLDQFTRNVFRGTPRAFAGDARALAAARALVERGDDLRLAPLRRVFAYLPFEHAEEPAAQQASLRLFAALAREQPALAGYEDYARRHAEVVERFGRFPHRNAVLGRTSSQAEQDYLRQPGAGF